MSYLLTFILGMLSVYVWQWWKLVSKYNTTSHMWIRLNVSKKVLLAEFYTDEQNPIDAIGEFRNYLDKVEEHAKVPQ